MTDSAQMEILAQHNQQVTSHLSTFSKILPQKFGGFSFLMYLCRNREINI